MNDNEMHYYDLQRNWTRKIVPHLDNETLNAILVRDFSNYYLETLSEAALLGLCCIRGLSLDCQFFSLPCTAGRT